MDENAAIWVFFRFVAVPRSITQCSHHKRSIAGSTSLFGQTECGLNACSDSNNMRCASGTGEIKTFVTHDFFLSMVRVLSQSGTGASAMIAATMTSSAMGSRLQQPIVSVISIGPRRHLRHPNSYDRLRNQLSSPRRRNKTQAMLADGIAAENRIGNPVANRSERPPLLCNGLDQLNDRAIAS